MTKAIRIICNSKWSRELHFGFKLNFGCLGKFSCERRGEASKITGKQPSILYYPNMWLLWMLLQIIFNEYPNYLIFMNCLVHNANIFQKSQIIPNSSLFCPNRLSLSKCKITFWTFIFSLNSFTIGGICMRNWFLIFQLLLKRVACTFFIHIDFTQGGNSSFERFPVRAVWKFFTNLPCSFIIFEWFKTFDVTLA